MLENTSSDYLSTWLKRDSCGTAFTFVYFFLNSLNIHALYSAGDYLFCWQGQKRVKWSSCLRIISRKALILLLEYYLCSLFMQPFFQLSIRAWSGMVVKNIVREHQSWRYVWWPALKRGSCGTKWWESIFVTFSRRQKKARFKYWSFYARLEFTAESCKLFATPSCDINVNYIFLSLGGRSSVTRFRIRFVSFQSGFCRSFRNSVVS